MTPSGLIRLICRSAAVRADDGAELLPVVAARLRPRRAVGALAIDAVTRRADASAGRLPLASRSPPELELKPGPDVEPVAPDVPDAPRRAQDELEGVVSSLLEQAPREKTVVARTITAASRICPA